MTRRDKGHGGIVDPGEQALWRAYTQDIVPLNPEQEVRAAPAVKDRDAPGRFRPQPPLPERHVPSADRQPPQLDRRTAQKLKRGQFEIEARLDLHGLNQERAHRRLNAFVQKAFYEQCRCILVITGKGLRKSEGQEGGLLRRQLPLWLSLPPLDGMVLKLQSAAPKDGGSGAFYVYLKRQRS